MLFAMIDIYCRNNINVYLLNKINIINIYMAWLGHPASFIIHQSLWILKKNVTVPLVSLNLLKHTWFDVYIVIWHDMRIYPVDKELIFKVHYVASWLSSELFITTCSQQSFDNLKNHTITVWTLYTYTSCTWKILEKYSTEFELWSNELKILHHIHSTSFIVCAIILLDLFIDLFIQRRKTL